MKMFSALAADFTQEEQHQQIFQRLFSEERYALLAKHFQAAIPHIKELGLSRKQPLTFTVDHVRIDNMNTIHAGKMRTNTSSEEFLKERGLL